MNTPNRLEKVSQLSTILSLFLSIVISVGGIIWYFAGFDARLESLEAQISTIGGAQSVLSQPSAGLIPENAPNSPFGVAIDPIAVRCADLADRVAKAYEEGKSLSTAKPILEFMVKLGCLKEK
jgi:hypothetical protein